MKKFLVSLLLLVTAAISPAQQTIRCSTMEDDSILRAQHNLESLQDFENWLQQQIAVYKASDKYLSGERNVVTIPIIFHIIHDGDAVGSSENISLAQVNSQIAVLNEDYRKAFGTAGYNTNPVGADCEIEFCAAVVDPNGNVLAEPGVHRVNMGQSEWTQTEVNATVKPQTIWDPARYCNVWTVRFGGTSANLLGYAQFPSSSGLQGLNNNSGSANTDGVVIRFNSCGRIGNVSAPYNKGRTLVHELGHWLGLRHIWGDQNCGNDYCNDTPTSSGANYGCPTGQNTCPDPGNDMVENYMDYTNDACMNIFTNDQKTRMMTVLSVSPRRASLTSSNVCVIPFTFSYTGRVIDAVTNQPVPNAKVLLDGAADYTPTTDANGYFTISNLQQDNYAIYAGKWGYVTATVASQLFSPATPQITVALQPGYYDDFLFDFNWTENGTATTGKWVRGIPVGTTYTTGGTTYQCNPGLDVTGDYGSHCYVTGNGGGAAGDDDIDNGTTILTSPSMDLTGFAEPVVRYYRWFFNSGGSGSPNDSLIVSLINGTQSVDIDNVAAGANTNVWTYKSYRVKDYFPNPGNNVTVKFRTFDNNPGHLVEAGIDLFRVLDSTAASSVPPVANFSANTKAVCVGQAVTFNDLSTNNPNSWSWTFQGGSPSTANNPTPVVTYNTPGTYTVSLTVGNNGGTNSITQTGFIKVEGVVANFDQDVQGICPGLQVSFNNGSSCNPTTIKWNFPGGDPASSTQEDPVVTYSSPGYYDVVLIAGNQFGADTLVQNLAVQVFAPPALQASTVSDTDFTGVGTATVNINIGTPPYTYKWSDPQQQTTATAVNLTAGNYFVTVTDGNGCKSITSMAVPNTVVNSTAKTEAAFVRLYPNPLKGDLLYVYVSAAGKAYAEVYNAIGQTVVFAVLQQGVNEVPMSDKAAGVYLVRITSGNSVQTVKVVKE
ncbi:MAG: PKD domain-containing protein [Chitinophagales bacterium]|nr:PKD domain-containing protein [Chitinophagales bacterium]